MELKFNNGRFRVMQIADVQDTQRTSDATVHFIREALRHTKPDLVVFTGDQIKGYGFNLMGGDSKKKVTECLNRLLAPLDETGIPFTFVFGNHDDQAFSISKKEQFEIYNTRENCVAFNADDSIDGYCNHNLEIKGADGKTKLNIYLMDSLTATLDGSCDHVHENQLEWYKNTRDRLKEENGHYIPSVVFQHIPVNEIYELLMEVPKGTPGAVQGYRKWAGKFFAMNPALVNIDERAFIGETPSVPEVNGGEFDAMNEKGDVFLMLFGHDHNNSFIGQYKGMKMGYTQGCGFNVYGPGKNRGVRLIDFNEEDPTDFISTTLTVNDLIDFDTGNKLKYGFYTYAPTSVDAVKDIAKTKVLPVAAAAGAVYALYKIIKKK
ncbi:MAG: metallophosphoesterase family protein [Clostridia bacterium]|nr:metallophosphoesterase family protein [Clostridia bacterium]